MAEGSNCLSQKQTKSFFYALHHQVLARERESKTSLWTVRIGIVPTDLRTLGTFLYDHDKTLGVVTADISVPLMQDGTSILSCKSAFLDFSFERLGLTREAPSSWPARENLASMNRKAHWSTHSKTYYALSVHFPQTSPVSCHFGIKLICWWALLSCNLVFCLCFF